MKKYIKISVALLLIGIISILGYSVSKKINYKKEVSERIQTIPKFSFATIQGRPFTEKEITKTKPKLFIYFNSDCHFCHGEAEQVKENLEKLENVQLVFVSFEAATNIADFAKKYTLNNKENIIFLEDEKMHFAQLFDANTIPFMALYSKENKLIKQFKGATNIKKIIDQL